MRAPPGSNGNKDLTAPEDVEPSAKRRHLGTEASIALPHADYYSAAHLTDCSVTQVGASEPTETIVTTLADGSCVFWKRAELDLVLIKRVFAHHSKILGLAVDNSFKTNFITIAKSGSSPVGESADMEVIVWDIANIDIIRKERIGQFDSVTTLFYLASSDRLAGFSTEGAIYLLDLNNELKVQEIKSGFKSPILFVLSACKFNITILKDGYIDYWKYLSESKPYALPGTEDIDFSLRLRTDLFELKKRKVTDVICATTDSAGRSFALAAITAQNAGRIFIYGVRSGQIIDEFECSTTHKTLCFDGSGAYLFYHSADQKGMTIRDINSKRSLPGPGSGDDCDTITTMSYCSTEREDKIPGITSAIKAGSVTPIEPLLLCGMTTKLAVYRLTGGTTDDAMRDRVSEVLMRKQQCNSSANSAKPKLSDLEKENLIRDPDRAVIYTTVGDISLILEPSLCPKTVENFAVHAQSHYYDGTVFHRVIQDFMIQGGDPNGDGTGGESIWGGYFQDEFNEQLNHNLPFVISMANGGPATNGSQFFITTVPCPFLNNKHTVFGRCSRGQEIVKSIESVKTNINDKPLRDIRIITIKISKSTALR